MTINKQALRECFEKWWEINYHNGKPPRFGWEYWRDGEGYQIDDDESELDGMWESWQAAHSEKLEAAEKRIAELEQRHHIKPCQKCNGTGMADSGGTQPWGEPIEIECDCRQQDANTAELVAAGIITKVGSRDMAEFKIDWLNKCRCGAKSATVKTARGNELSLWDDDSVKCNACGREGVIQVCEGQARALWETDEERAQIHPIPAFTKDPSTYPANGPLTEDRLIRVRDELAAAAKRSDGGNLGYMMADAAKAIDELLALRKAGQEPVAYMQIDGDEIEYNGHNEFSGGGKGVPLYAAPQLPQPAVAITKHFDTIALDVAKMVMCDVNRRDEFLGGDIQLLSRIQCRIDEACRAAMLQGAEPVSQPYTLLDGLAAIRSLGPIDAGKIQAERDALNEPDVPDGYALVPVEPTEKMVIEGFESAPHPLFQPADWDKYQTMSGCEQAAHRAKLCWAAMIKAAPKP